MHDTKLKECADKIARHLFEGYGGARAERLVLRDYENRELGGWVEHVVSSTIHQYLRQLIQEPTDA